MPGIRRVHGKIAEAILAACPAGVVRPYLMVQHQVGPFFMYLYYTISADKKFYQILIKVPFPVINGWHPSGEGTTDLGALTKNCDRW